MDKKFLFLILFFNCASGNLGGQIDLEQEAQDQQFSHPTLEKLQDDIRDLKTDISVHDAKNEKEFDNLKNELTKLDRAISAKSVEDTAKLCSRIERWEKIIRLENIKESKKNLFIDLGSLPITVKIEDVKEDSSAFCLAIVNVLNNDKSFFKSIKNSFLTFCGSDCDITLRDIPMITVKKREIEEVIFQIS